MRSRIILPLALAAAALLLLVIAGVSAQGTLLPKEQLGKQLFFDTNLSTPPGLACAGCHGPEVGYTGPDAAINAAGAVYEGAMAGRFGNRKPPSAAYAGDSPILQWDGTKWVGGMFWDGRATGWTLGDPLAEQAQGPFLNPLEHNNASAQVVIDKVLASSYHDRFLQACTDSSKYYACIGRAIAAYERSAEVSQFTSKYDYWLKGQARLTVQEQNGLELFNGKAKCTNCHVTPNFTDFTYDNLGVPRNPSNPFYNEPAWNPAGAAWVDTGLGGFLKAAGYSETVYTAEWGKHKVPTLRNVDLRPTSNFVKAYSHNGYFKSLEEIVHFYNTRDVSGAGWPLPEVDANINTTEMGNLGLNHLEELAIVAFLSTLSDGYTADFSLTITPVGTGTGTITSAPTGIDCGSTCSAAFTYNASITLTASAGVGSTFAGWSGAGCSGTGTCTVTMSQARSVIATFTSSGVVTYAPTVTGVTPASGPVAGGTAVTITGTAFRTGATVTVGGTAATAVTVVNATTITATTPAHAAGTPDVVVTNSDSQAATLAGGFTYVPASHYYLAEGATVWTFETLLALVNPGDQAAPVTVTFMKEDGSSVETTRTVAANSRDTLRVADVPGMVDSSFGTVVTSTDGIPLVVERLMTWDGGHAAHSGMATDTLATSWYFAEGAQQPLDTYLLVANPGDTKADVTVTFLLTGATPVVRTLTIEPRMRATVWAGSVPELQYRSFSMTVSSSQPVVAERSLYFGASRHWDGGTSAMGVTTPSADWYFAEGSTGPIFDMYLLLGNPNADAAEVNVTYLLADGTAIPKTYAVNGQERSTIFVPGEAPGLAQAGGVGVEVHANRPVLAERAMYWMPGYQNWRDGHASAGSPTTGTQWAFAEGSVGGTNSTQTYLLLANPGTTASEVQVTYLRENGLPPVVKTYTVGATSRLTVWVNGATELSNERFGAVVTVTSGAAIVAERSMYWDMDGTWWAAGTVVLGARGFGTW